MKREVEIILPELKDGKYIEYKVYNAGSDKLERFRIYKGFAKLKSSREVEIHAEKLIDRYSDKLRSGWRPWSAETVIYRDEFTYNTEQANFGNKRKDSFHVRRYASLFFAELKSRKLAKKSEQTYQSKIRMFLMWAEKQGYDKLRPGEISNSIIKDFFNHLISIDLDRSTIANYRIILFKLFEFCRKSKVINTNPVFEIVIPARKKDFAARPLLDCDVEKILSEAAKKNPQFLLACLFQLLCCCRPKELRFIKIKDVDLYNANLFIGNEGGKTGARNVQMPNILIEICTQMNIYSYDRDFYLFGNGGEPGTEKLPINKLGDEFRGIRKKLRLPTTYKFYSFKHTGAGKLLESGATVIEVMKLLGHTSLESTIHYIHRHFGEKSEKVTNFYPQSIRGIAGLFAKK